MNKIDTFSIKTSHYIIGAVALTTALSWNGAIREAINKGFPAPKDEVFMGLLYAIIITIVLILLIEYLPDTTNELPKSTKEKIQNVETQTNILNRLTRLERFVANSHNY
jgi:hypothetical protein